MPARTGCQPGGKAHPPRRVGPEDAGPCCPACFLRFRHFLLTAFPLSSSNFADQVNLA